MVDEGGDYLRACAGDGAVTRRRPSRLHFDDSREDNGPLRVLPGTHALGVLSESDTERLVREIPPIDCLVTSGGIVAMRPLILHASSKAETDHPRRVLHIEYVDSLDIGEGLRIAIA
jgi:ectoine hydroxylase-related dioxygenase (phytanoyl-CoA dioxygenase family)